MKWRNAVRILLLLVGLALTGWLLWDFWPNFRGWRALKGVDPSAAEIYSDGCLIDGGLAVATLGIAIALFVVTRPKGES